MRHRVETKKLNRKASHRKALVKGMATSLIEHEKMETTLVKAKYLRPYIERLVTRAKKDKSFNTVKYLRNLLTTEESVKKLLENIAPRFVNTMGGYTRIVKTRNRDGDNAVMARIEFTEKKKKEAAPKAKSTKTAKVKTPEVKTKAKETKEVKEVKPEVTEEKANE